MHALPIGQRRTGDDDRPEQIRPQRRQHHDRPAGLAIADHAWLVVGFRVKLNDLFQKNRFCAGDVANRLPGHGVGQKADEVTRVPGFQRDADFAIGLEAADAGTVTGARIDNNKGPLRRVDLDACRRNDPHQTIIHRPFEAAAVHDQLGFKLQHVRRGLRHVLAILIAALAHDVPEQGCWHTCPASTRYSSAWKQTNQQTASAQPLALSPVVFDLTPSQQSSYD